MRCPAYALAIWSLKRSIQQEGQRELMTRHNSVTKTTIVSSVHGLQQKLTAREMRHSCSDTDCQHEKDAAEKDVAEKDVAGKDVAEKIFGGR